MLVAVVADRGAPGVSTTALALALTHPQGAVLAEVDPAGSTLAYRLPADDGKPLALTRGLVTWAAQARTDQNPATLWNHLQQLDGGLPVLVGPATPEQASSVGSVWGTLASMMAQAPVDVIADCGRVLNVDAAVAPVIAAADWVLVVARPTAESLAGMRHGLKVIQQIRATGQGLDRVAVVAVNSRPRGLASSAERDVLEVIQSMPGFTSVPVLGSVPWDAKTAAAWVGTAPSPRKSKLLDVTRKLHNKLAVSTGEPFSVNERKTVDIRAEHEQV